MNRLRSPVCALVWEIGRKNRWGFVVLVLSGACGLTARSFGPGGDDVPKSIAGLAMVVCFVVAFAIFSYADSGARVWFPARTFTLPVRTALLVHCPMICGAAVIALIHLAWGMLFLRPLDAHYPVGLFTLYWIPALMAFQAVVWNLADCPKSFATALTAAVLVFVRLAVILVGEPKPPVAAAWLVAIGLAAYLAARVGIGRRRRGEWRLPERVEAAWERLQGAVRGGHRPFPTAERALFWMEARRNAVVPLLLLVIGLILARFCFGIVGSRLGQDSDLIPTAFLYLFGALFALWAVLSGLLIARDPSQNSLALSAFLATRPVRAGDLVGAKVKLAGVLTLAGWLAYSAGLSFWFAHCSRPGDPVIRQDTPLMPAMSVLALALGWHLIGALPVWLAGRIGSPAWAGLFLLGGYIAAGQVLEFVEKHFGLRGALPWLFALAFAGKIVAAAWSFREAIRRGLLAPRAAARYWGFWAVGTMGLVAVAWGVSPAAWRSVALPGAALLVPLARVGVAPLALAWARHR